MATSRILKRPRVLLAHPDGEWVGRAKATLEGLGYAVTECLELGLVADVYTGTRPFELLAVSNALDPDSQMRILRALKAGDGSSRLLLLLDALDSATQNVAGGRGGIFTHRVSDDVGAFAAVVASALGPAPRPPGP